MSENINFRLNTLQDVLDCLNGFLRIYNCQNNPDQRSVKERNLGDKLIDGITELIEECGGDY